MNEIQKTPNYCKEHDEELPCGYCKTLEHFDNCPIYKKHGQCACLLGDPKFHSLIKVNKKIISSVFIIFITIITGLITTFFFRTDGFEGVSLLIFLVYIVWLTDYMDRKLNYKCDDQGCHGIDCLGCPCKHHKR